VRKKRKSLSHASGSRESGAFEFLNLILERGMCRKTSKRSAKMRSFDFIKTLMGQVFGDERSRQNS
jgi:hypothetical protein